MITLLVNRLHLSLSTRRYKQTQLVTQPIMRTLSDSNHLKSLGEKGEQKMTKEELLALGITEEQITEIFKINGKDVEKAKGDLTTKEVELKALQDQLRTANKQIEDFKELDVEGIKKAAADYKTMFEKAEEESKGQIKDLTFNHSLEKALIKAGAKNVKAAKALLDLDNLKESSNMISDIEAAITKAKEEASYLYGEADPEGTGGSKGAGGKGTPPPVENYGATLGKDSKKVVTDTSKYEL